MLNLKNKHIKYSKKEKVYINHITQTPGEHWKIATNDMKALKNKIMRHLLSMQNERCAYCKSRLDVGGRSEIEHIAPKGRELYPEFSFNEYNLVLACQNCNGSSKKGFKNIVQKHSKHYRRCKFYIVHPYMNNSNHHYIWANGIEIVIIAGTPKADFSITMFKLNSPHLTEQRAMELLKEKHRQSAGLTIQERETIDNAISHFD